MHDAQQSTGFDALDKATTAAGIAISLVMRVPAPLKSLADQVIRSASSVPANLAEGAGRSGRDRHPPLPHRLRLSQGSRHPSSSPRRSRRNRQRASRHYPPSLRRRPSHDLASPPPEITIAMIVGPASRRPIRALVDPRRAARQSNAALVCHAIWSRVFPSNTCVIGISQRSESPKSRSTTLTTRDYPIRT